MDMYDRQIRAFGQRGQEILQKLTVGIVGVGGIGATVFLILVRLGVRRIIILDPDVVEASNLNRLAGSTQEDAVQQRPKVEVLARYAARINPRGKVTTIQKSILEEGPAERLKKCDAIFGCTDNHSSRWVQNEFAVKYLIPYFDIGTGIQADSKHNIEHAGGQVRVVIPGMGCLNCIDGIDVDIAQQEMRPEKDRQVAEQLGYIAGADVKAPAVATLNGVPANLAVTEFLAFFTGFRPVQRFVGYDFLKAKVTPYVFPRDPNCFTCGRIRSLAVGDRGKALPVELLINEPEPKDTGEIEMQEQTIDIGERIADLLAHAEKTNLPIEGHADNRWFVVKDVKLGKGFSSPTAPIMVKFFGESPDPVIFVPEKIQLDSNAAVCSNFLATEPCLKGWKVLCPHMFQDVGDELLQFIACLCGFLARPELCGCMGCPGKEAKNEGA